MREQRIETPPVVERLFDQVADLEGPAPLGLAAVRLSLLRDLRPVRPALPTGWFALAFLLIFAALSLLSLRFMAPLGWVSLQPMQRASLFTTLAASASLLAFALSRQMSPGSRSLPPATLLSGLFVLFCLVAAGLFHTRAEAHFLLDGQSCLQQGTPYAIPAALLFVFILRLGALLNPTGSAALTGMLAGLVSTTALEIHCPNQNLWHILTFHFGIPAAGATLGAAAVWCSRTLSAVASRAGKP